MHRVHLLDTLLLAIVLALGGCSQESTGAPDAAGDAGAGDAGDADAGRDAGDDGGSGDGDDGGDGCVPEWTDRTACDCTPRACLECTGTKEQSDGCGHTREVGCTLPATGCPAGQACTAEGLCAVQASNPVIPGDGPDPHVLRLEEDDGTPVYYLTHTVHNGGDFPLYRSFDLVHWERLTPGLFDRSSPPGDSLQVNDGHFCSRWAPHLTRVRAGVFMLGFSAARFSGPQTPCPPYAEDGGVYLASAAAPTGPYAVAGHPWEPLPAGAHEASCPADVRVDVPHSVDYASADCQGNYCHKIIRLDSDVFVDPQTGRWWMAYSWYTNTPPQVAWEEENHGEHVELVELDPADPFAVICDRDVPQIFAANPHDTDTLARLAGYCPRCGDMLSHTRGRYGEEMVRDGFSWGVAEGASLFRRGGYVYLLLSGSAWDSPYYHVYWTAAPSVAELVYSNPDRLVGRYLVPGQQQSFGHGTAVLGPDGRHWYFVHHRLDSQRCQNQGDCARDVWVSPIEFEDRGDGLGDVHIRPRFPAEQPVVDIIQP